MSLANPRWGAPRIHGELLKIGIEVSQATVAKYMARHGKPPSQTWRTFLMEDSEFRRERLVAKRIEERASVITENPVRVSIRIFVAR
ncbi:MAG: hypothetical protein DMG54_33420 [Acidobacteria bacterium]|nr:MAG: hypothetical protein DMG54_33420 [Acidobacteriota bacterium]